jgi:hypothetical protein
MPSSLSIVVGVLLFVFVLAAWRRRRRADGGAEPKKPRPIGSIGPGAAGAFYEFLNEEKRKAIEIVVEERAGYSDPETKDGDLPQFEVRGLDKPGRR